MFGRPGLAYVYLVYGMYDCLNVVTGEEGAASAVLIRAVEPIAGSAAMIAGREATAARLRRRPAAPRAGDAVASGPGRLCAAFGIDRSFNGVDLCDPTGPLRLELGLPDDRPPQPGWTPRVGVAYAGEPWASLAWRLVDRSSPALSTAAGGATRPQPDPPPAGLAVPAAGPATSDPGSGTGLRPGRLPDVHRDPDAEPGS